MAELTPEQRAFIRENPFYAVATTLRKDGSPHNTIVWIDEEDGAVLMNTARGRAKERHLVADPRIAVTVMDPADAYKWVSVTGTAELRDEDGDAVIDRLSHKYMGKDYPWHKEGEQRVTVVVHPERVDALGV